MSKRLLVTCITALLILLALAAAIGLFNDCDKTETNENAEPQAENGFIDLSSWDFEQQGNVKLDGYWEFYPNRLLTPAELVQDAVRPEHYIEVPKGWSNSETSDFMEDKGFGTYRLQVRVNPDIAMFGIKTTYIRNASRMFVNGKPVGDSGTPASSADEGYVSRNVPYTAFFPVDGDRLDIIVHVANLDYYYGGIIQSVYLGAQHHILMQALKMNIMDTIGFAFFLLSFIYYLGIYFRRPQDKRLFYFALFCIMYTFVLATSNERLFMQIFDMIPYMFVLKIRFFIIGLSIACLCLFICEMEKSLIPRVFNKVVVIGMSALFVIGTMIPVAYYGYMEAYLVWLYLAALLSIGGFILKAVVKKRYGKPHRRTIWLLFIGIMLLFVQFASMVLYLYSIINTTVVPMMSTLLFLFGIAVMFADQYKQAYDEIEDVSHKLIEADKIKDEFLIHTSHEFKTPLHGIINLAQVVVDQSGHGMTKKQRENMDFIISQATRLSMLVNDIIDFQNLKRRSLTFHKQLFDVSGTVQATLEVLKYLRKGDDVQLVNQVLPGAYFLFTDENRFKQIVVNLVSNALKFTEQGHVEAAAYSRGGWIYLTFTDTGIGMSEERQKQLFTDDLFEDERAHHASAYRSSGLGLKISQILALQMGGGLELKWSEPGKGTVFELRLPKATAAQKEQHARSADISADSMLQSPKHDAPEEDAAHVQSPEQAGKIKILLVDDETSNIKVLRELFASSRYHILVAYNGTTALELLEVNKDVSLVLLDVMMPGLSGYEVCRRIREEHPIYKLPVLLLTVRHSSDDVAAGLEAGANDFLAKPFDGKELMARVQTLLQLKETVEQTVQMETLFLQSQIKPHFIYNALNGIISLCYSDGARAGKLLGEFSNYLRLSFDLDPHHAKVSLSRELSLVKSYVELEKARFGERLKVEWDVDARKETLVPALIIQPLVENAIRHGLMRRIAGGTVSIQASERQRGLQITVRDDGVGMSAEQVEKILSPNRLSGSIGLINVHRRLINEYGNGLQIESVQGKGTEVTILIPSRVWPNVTEQAGEL